MKMALIDGHVAVAQALYTYMYLGTGSLLFHLHPCRCRGGARVIGTLLRSNI